VREMHWHRRPSGAYMRKRRARDQPPLTRLAATFQEDGRRGGEPLVFSRPHSHFDPGNRGPTGCEFCSSLTTVTLLRGGNLPAVRVGWPTPPKEILAKKLAGGRPSAFRIASRERPLDFPRRPVPALWGGIAFAAPGRCPDLLDNHMPPKEPIRMNAEKNRFANHQIPPCSRFSKTIAGRLNRGRAGVVCGRAGNWHPNVDGVAILHSFRRRRLRPYFASQNNAAPSTSTGTAMSDTCPFTMGHYVREYRHHDALRFLELSKRLLRADVSLAQWLGVSHARELVESAP